MTAVDDSLCRLEQAGKQTDFFRSFSLFWLISTFIIMVAGIIAWFYYREHLIYIKKRGIIKPFMLFIAISANTVTGPLDRAVPGRESEVHSCTVLSISFLLPVPFVVIAGLAQVFLFRNRYSYYKALGSNTPLGSEASSRQSFFAGFDSSLRRKHLLADERFVGGCVVALGLAFILIVIGVVSTLCPEYGSSDDCEFATISDVRVMAVLLPPIIVGLLLSVYINKQLKTFPDPFNLLGEIKSIFFYGLTLAIPGFVLAGLNFGDPNGQEEVPFSYSVWIDAVLVFVFVYSVHWQIYKAMKFDEIRLLYHNITLATLLKDKVGRDLFKAHLTNEFSLENLLFIEAVESFRKSSPEQVEIRAQRVFDMFFKEDILNVKYQTANAVKETFEQGAVTLNTFDVAYNEVYQLTSLDSFARFQLTADFEEYIGLRQSHASIGNMLT